MKTTHSNTTLSKRKLQALETKKKINDAALLLMQENDFDSISVSQICEQAGVSIGSFYNYFPSKDFIIFSKADCDKSLNNFFAQNPLDGNACEDIMTIYKYQLNYVVEKFGLQMQVQFFKSQLSQYKTGNDIFYTEDRPLKLQLTKIVERGAESGDLVLDISTKQFVRNLSRIYYGFLYDWCVHNGNYDLKEEAYVALSRYVYSYAGPKKDDGTAETSPEAEQSPE